MPLTLRPTGRTCCLPCTRRPQVARTAFTSAMSPRQTTLLFYGESVHGAVLLSLRSLLRRRNPCEKRVAFVGTTYAMFVLGTTQMVLSLCTIGVSVRMVQALVEQDAVDALVRLWRVYFSIDVAQNIVFVANNYIAATSSGDPDERSLLHPHCAYCLHYIERRAPFFMNVATNALLVWLTAGRIWWVERRARGLLGDGTPRPARYATAIAMILKSGSIYCFCLILQVVAQSLVPSNASMIFFGLSTGFGQQGVNIAPALIVVRVGGGGSGHEPHDDLRRRITSQIVFHQNTPLSILSSRNSRPDIEAKRSNLEAEIF
ncbi:hypothetical protein B0H14DRAFT_2725326 [Mycena olivaceomarginata]|nr:hypothetical protein B0H14DRAFT_2725326 [Mycena olivaceomarginata]